MCCQTSEKVSPLTKFYLLIFIMLSFAAESAATEPNCAQDQVFTGQLFELSIEQSFEDDIVFRFCVSDDSSYLISQKFQTAYVHDGRFRPALNYESKVKLTSSLKDKIKTMYLKAMLNSLPDDVSGHDGSFWCFRPKSGAGYTESCYWSPIWTKHERELVDIADLGIFLFELSGLEQYGGVLQ